MEDSPEHIKNCSWKSGWRSRQVNGYD